MIEKKPHNFLQRIFEFRRARRVTLKDLGKACGVGESGASSIENGDVPLKAEDLPKVAKLLGVKIWELFQDYDVPAGDEPIDEEAKNIVKLWRKLPEKDRGTITNLLFSLAKTEAPKKGEHRKSA